jgi:hypothetical protein
MIGVFLVGFVAYGLGFGADIDLIRIWTPVTKPSVANFLPEIAALVGELDKAGIEVDPENRTTGLVGVGAVPY